MTFFYITLDDVLSLHELLISEFGGSKGVRDIALIESAVARPQQTYGGDDLYPTIFEKTAALFQSLVKNHPFVDGNKRIASLTAVSFLEFNGRIVTASNAELVRITLFTVTDSPDITEIAKWFEENSEPV